VELVVDLEKVTVILAGPDDTDRLSVVVVAPSSARPEQPADVHRLGDVLVATGVGRLEGDVALVSPEAITFHAAGAVEEGWEERFARAREYAQAKGWVDPSDGYLQAHVEWPARA
jgi:hypothetical protein